YAYEKGQRATVELAWNDAAQTLTVGKRQGTFPGLVKERVLHVVLADKTQGVGIAESPATTGRTLRYTGKKAVVKF
ncbi:MAG: hypothetical protein RIQ79_1643, partial [Verrucomicrobiota bacterium]